MERRTFIQTLGTVALTFPLIRCDRNSEYISTISLPVILSYIVDEKTIQAIGVAYRTVAPDEASVGKLQDLLTRERSDFKNAGEVRSFIENQIGSDFSKNNVTIVSGWILSTTECRQCALYSLQRS